MTHLLRTSIIMPPTAWAAGGTALAIFVAFASISWILDISTDWSLRKPESPMKTALACAGGLTLAFSIALGASLAIIRLWQWALL